MKANNIFSFRFGIAIVIVSIILGMVAFMGTYIDENNILHETLLTPISAFIFLIGLVVLIITLVRKYL